MSRSRQRAANDNETSLELYDQAAQAASAQVIAHYSTSFGVGSRMLPRAMRHHIESVYAMVRVADEIVDTYMGPDAPALLDDFEAEVLRAMDGRFSTNLVAHAFGATSRAVGIDRTMVDPFFASMRMDLERTEHDQASFERYVFGSAEVVGEMCLAVFVNTRTGPRPIPDDLRAGARRLGAAYQKVNFLRDLGADSEQLGRSYFPGISASTLTDHQLAGLVEDCRADIDAARATLPGLPRRARIAVATTIDIYERLLTQIAATDASALVATRVRVSDPTKLALAARNIVGRQS
ncbi:phytoene/squalene synthase family protein [Demequina activiva]|uniref:Phytoene synthase n=1 Tax=Demequina activiva TaxID=1582364 RepID=A0A919Q157_9MICO|nr:squalene/phytoene synthase family protein [Demequina activiva]GIG54124.1 phytoene synthase [Demequina activiva]